MGIDSSECVYKGLLCAFDLLVFRVVNLNLLNYSLGSKGRCKDCFEASSGMGSNQEVYFNSL